MTSDHFIKIVEANISLKCKEIFKKLQLTKELKF